MNTFMKNSRYTFISHGGRTDLNLAQKKWFWRIIKVFPYNELSLFFKRLLIPNFPELFHRFFTIFTQFLSKLFPSVLYQAIPGYVYGEISSHRDETRLNNEYILKQQMGFLYDTSYSADVKIERRGRIPVLLTAEERIPRQP